MMFARLDFSTFLINYVVLEIFLIINPTKNFLLQFVVGTSVYLLDYKAFLLLLEYLYRRVATTHDLNAILYPPSSENTVRCIAV